jgi:hypothetical protein
MADESGSRADRLRWVKETFVNKSVVTMWGHHRAYKVKNVVFDMNP